MSVLPVLGWFHICSRFGMSHIFAGFVHHGHPTLAADRYAMSR